jgi:hypothetical protein
MTDGFSNTEKFQSLSTSRTDAGTASATGNDVLSVVSSGSFNIAVGDSVEVTFALVAGRSLSEIQGAADAAQSKYDNIFIGIEHIGNSNGNELYSAYPNPAVSETRINFSLKESTVININIYNLLGEKVMTVADEKLNSGKYSIPVDVSRLKPGQYFYQLTTDKFSKSLPISILR